MTNTTLSPRIFKAALGLLDTTLREFCVGADVSLTRLSEFQSKPDITLTDKTIQKILRYCQNRGVRIESNGVSLIEGVVELHGRDGFHQLYEDLYATIKDGGEFRIFNGVSEQFINGLGEDYIEIHKARMEKIAPLIRSRAIVKDGDYVFFGRKYTQYRSMAPENFTERTMFIYGDRAAFANLGGDEPYIQLNRSKEIADMCAKLFDLAWEHQAKEIPDENY